MVEGGVKYAEAGVAGVLAGVRGAGVVDVVDTGVDTAGDEGVEGAEVVLRNSANLFFSAGEVLNLSNRPMLT